jgi:hypothetical protein
VKQFLEEYFFIFFCQKEVPKLVQLLDCTGRFWVQIFFWVFGILGYVVYVFVLWGFSFGFDPKIQNRF